jgi:hypothetical protein
MNGYFLSVAIMNEPAAAHDERILSFCAIMNEPAAAHGEWILSVLWQL